MKERVTPMIHVPDVAATVEWYRDLGFTVNNTYGQDGEGLSFAILSFGSSQVMFNQGGQASQQRRREVDLYVYANDVDQHYERLKDRVDVIEGPHDTFYGMREFIFRDCNRFWITFGQTSAFGDLMNAISESDADAAQAALASISRSESLKPERLTAALLAATQDEHQNPEIIQMLEQAGAELPPEIDEAKLQSHVGYYQSEKGMKVEMILREGQLFAAPESHAPLSLIAVSENVFRPAAFEGVTVTFNVQDGKTKSFVLKQGSESTELSRVTEPGAINE